MIYSGPQPIQCQLPVRPGLQSQAVHLSVSCLRWQQHRTAELFVTPRHCPLQQDSHRLQTTELVSERLPNSGPSAAETQGTFDLQLTQGSCDRWPTHFGELLRDIRR